MANFLFKKRSFFKTVLITCAVILHFSPVFGQQQVVGSIDGVFNVSDLGGASYTIPLKIPEGINGVQPTLSLNYSSQSGNGILGMGWNLSGLSAITRTSQNIYDDNATKGIALSGDDRFALDGQRLVMTSGSNYGAAGSQYATEVESYKLIKANGTSGSGPLSFTVTDQNGWIFTYGGSANSRVASGSNIIAWYISDVKDLNGNTIAYTYNNDGAESPAIAAISYNGNSSQGLADLTKISFSYSDRTDKNFQYIGGKKLSQSKLLTSLSIIQSPSGSAVTVRKYIMEYHMDFYSHLVKVREVGVNNAEEVGPTTIAYNTATDLLIKSQPQISASLGLTYVPGDFNGDGKTDFVVMPDQYNPSYNTWQLVKNTGNSFTKITEGNLPDMSGVDGYSNDELDHKPIYNNNTPAFFNYNGDGYDDFIYRTSGPLENQDSALYPKKGKLNKDVYHILVSDGNTVAPILGRDIKPGSAYDFSGNVVPVPRGYFRNSFPLVGDFDGDGKHEILVLKESIQYSESENYLIGENYLTPYGNNDLLAQPLFGMPFDATNLKDPNIGARVKLFVIDYDGDGKNEILSVWQGHAQVFRLNVTFDANHKPTVGDPAFVLVNETGYPTVWHDIFTGDFNGDGITDVLTYGNGGWEFGYGKGNGLMNDEKPAPAGLTNKPSNSDGIVERPVVIGDFNGDGKDDIFDYTDGIATFGGNAQEPHIFYSLGNNQFQTVYPSNLNSSMFLLSAGLSGYCLCDCNGDGATDFITRPNIYATQSSFCFHPDEKRHLVSKITNGLGAFTKINYASIANNAGVYQSGSATSTYPVVRKTIPLKVVSSTVEDNGINTTGNTTTFKYEGLKFGFWGRGVLGFDKVTTTNNVTLASTEKTYSLNTDYFVPQLTSVVNKVNGTTVSSSSNTYGIKSFGGKRIFPYISRTFSIDNITQQNTQTTYDYNVPNGPFGPTGFDIGKPNTITTLKGYRNYIGYINGAFQTVTSQIEKTVQSFTYPNYSLIIIGSPPLPYQARFLPLQIATTKTRTGDAAYTRYQKLTYNYDRGLLLTSVADPSSGNQAVTTTYAYDGFGNKVSESVSATGLPSTTKAYEYSPVDPRFCMKSYNTAYPNVFTQYGYNPWTGDLLNKTDPDGFKTNYTYDAFGRLKSTSNNNGQSSTVQYALATSVPNAKYTITTDDNTSGPSVVYYDRLGREVRNTRTGFNGETIIQNTTYNNKGQVVSTSLPYFSSGTAQNTTYHYDIYGRQTSVVAPTGTTSYTYTGTPDNTSPTTAGLNKGKYAVKITDPSGYSKTTTMDAAGAAISTEDAGGLLEYAYNSNGGMKATTLSGQQVQSVDYDAFGRKITETDPNYGSYHYTYNAYGQLLSRKDPAGNLYQYTYNNLGGVATKTGPEGTYTYTYGLAAGPNVFKLTKLAGPEGTINYTYGKGDQVLSEKRSTGSNVFTNVYTYNTVGQLATRTYPDGSKVAYTYNVNDGSCSNIGIPGETIPGPSGTQPAYVYSITNKNAFDEVTQSGFGTFYAMSVGVPSPSIIEGKSYNQYGLLTGQSTFPMTSQGPMPNIRSVQYTFSPASGHLTMRKDLIHNLQENFTYDDLKRLKTVAGIPATVPNLNMDYDDNGNINTKSDAGTFAYDPANRVSEINPYVNIPASKQTLTYTPFKKVKTINEAGVTATFTYWPDGERASMTIAGGINPRTVYYAPGYEKVVAASYQREYSYLENEQGHIAAIIGKDDVTGKSFRYYVLTDYLGSITHVLNTNGSIAEEKSYDAWGRYRNPASWVAYAPTYSNMLFYRGYTGHEYIPEFGIINMNGRLYDPLLGRMFSPDPYIMGNDNTQGYNRYTYALNNPLSYTDPNGEFVHIIIGAVVGGVINLGIKAFQGRIHSWGDGFAAFGIGAVAGAVGAATGGAAFAAMGGAAGGIGGFFAGAAGGLAGSAVSSPIQSLGNSVYFGDPLMTPKQYAISLGIGTLLGGTTNGLIALSNGRNFWNGDLITKAVKPSYIEPLSTRGIEKTDESNIGQVHLKANTQKDFFESTKYTNKVLRQMQENNGNNYHNFPESVRAFQSDGTIKPIMGGDKVIRQSLIIEGTYKGQHGWFEFIKEADGSINHRFFETRPANWLINK